MSDHDPFIATEQEWDPASLRAELAETQRRLQQADRNWETALEEREAALRQRGEMQGRYEDLRRQFADLQDAAAALLAETGTLCGPAVTWNRARLKAAWDRVARLERHFAATIQVSRSAIPSVGAPTKQVRCPGSGTVADGRAPRPARTAKATQPSLPDVDQPTRSRGIKAIKVTTTEYHDHNGHLTDTDGKLLPDPDCQVCQRPKRSEVVL